MSLDMCACGERYRDTKHRYCSTCTKPLPQAPPKTCQCTGVVQRVFRNQASYCVACGELITSDLLPAREVSVAVSMTPHVVWEVAAQILTGQIVFHAAFDLTEDELRNADHDLLREQGYFERWPMRLKREEAMRALRETLDNASVISHQPQETTEALLRTVPGLRLRFPSIDPFSIAARHMGFTPGEIDRDTICSYMNFPRLKPYWEPMKVSKWQLRGYHRARGFQGKATWRAKRA